MKNNQLKKKWQQEEMQVFRGWDFSHLEGRWESEALPWNYKSLVLKHLKDCYKLLDMGTGGGEFLLSLNHPNENIAITEQWEPNYLLCKDKLEPLGIVVKQIFKDSELPFKDSSFDIIINRHEAYDIHEVKRVLKPEGLFITQQVGCKNNESLSKRLVKNFKSLFADNYLKYRLQELKDNNFEIIYSREYYPFLRFYDIGALVYFAKIIKWEFPGFSVDNSEKELYKLHTEIEGEGYVESFEHRFMIVARKKKI